MKIRTLDIKELNDRLAELEDLRDAVESERDNLEEATDKDRAEIQGRIDAAETDFGPEEQDELKGLEQLKEDIGERHGKIDDEGGPFVHENDFKEYAREFAEEIGATSGKESWPHNCIDWDKAASELQQDYVPVEWQGVIYYYRALTRQ